MGTASIVGLTIIGVFTLFILLKKKKRASDYMLAVINGLMGLNILAEGWILDGHVTAIELFVHFNANFWFISTFLMFAYSMVLNKGRATLHWWHFVFAAPMFVYSAIDLFILGDKGAAAYAQIMEDPNLVYHFFFKLHKVFIIVAGFHILKSIRKYQEQLKQSFSSIESISLGWVKNYTWFIIVLFSCHLIVFLMYNFQLISEIDTAYFVMGILIVIGVCYLSFFGIQQYNYQKVEEAAAKLPAGEGETQQVDEEPSKDAESELLCQRMIDLFEKEQLFTNSELRIANVAEALDVPVHKLSPAINAHFGKPFYDVVAEYRVANLKEKLVNPENKGFTILSLALDAGFNSKASLNRIFKEHTGETPSQYQKSHFTNKP